jgi:hypothetical protein
MLRPRLAIGLMLSFGLHVRARSGYWSGREGPSP